MTTVAAWRSANSDLDRQDCDLLLTHTLGISRADLLTAPERTLSPQHIAQLDEASARCRDEVPIAYVLGTAEFWGLTLAVDPRVLIPRPDTELLVELVVRDAPHNARVLELATGSGAISVALAHERPDLAITATDVADDALAVAASNAAAHNAAIEFRQADWFEGLTGAWDVVLANPPYVRADDPHLPGLRHEPLGALVPGPSGLEALVQIAAQAPTVLASPGALYLEHGYDQGPAVRELLTQWSYLNVSTHTDLGGRERATSANR